MPELPEVENVRQTISEQAVGVRIERARILHPGVVRNLDPGFLEKVLSGNRFTGFRRRGKYLLGDLESGQVLVIHLGMTGRFYVAEQGGNRPRHTHMILTLEEGRELRFQDVRRFGGLYLLRDPQDLCIPGLAGMGPEPLDPALTPEKWKSHLQGRKGKVKVRLLDQYFVAGIGNIYADEILFGAGIDPHRDLQSLGEQEQMAIYREMRRILPEAIGAGGSSIRDYVDGRGQAGDFQNRHRVYGRKGLTCTRCGSTLLGCKIAGRTTVYCPDCQR